MLILLIPHSIAFSIWLAGIPVPPCNTRGISNASLICFIVSKSRFGSPLYSPWTLPKAGAKESILVSFTKYSHSSNRALKLLPVIPSSLPPIWPISASTVTPLWWAYSTTSLVIAIFSSRLCFEASIITEVNPASIAFLHVSNELPWSTWRQTSMDIFKSSIRACTILATTFHPPMYLAAPSLTPKITGFSSLSISSKMYFVHSKLLILKCGTA